MGHEPGCIHQLLSFCSRSSYTSTCRPIQQNTIDFIQTLVEDNCTLHKQYQQLETVLKKIDDNNATTLLIQELQNTCRDHDMHLHWGRGEAIRGATRTLQRLQNSND